MIPAAILNLILNPRVLGALAIAAVVGFGYVHYRGLVSDLETAKQELVAEKASAQIAISTARENAEQAAKADEDRRRIVAELEAAQAELQTLKDSSQAEEKRILAAPAESDGPVAPVLNEWRNRRYGGRK